MSRFVLLVTVLVAVGQALVWSPTGTPDGAVLLTCDGSDVTIDWPFVLDTGDQIQDIKWYFQPPGGAESFIATVLQDPTVLHSIQGHFFTPRDRLTHVPPAGLKVTGVKASDVGLYSVQLTTHSSGHDVVHTRSARIEMDSTQPNCTQSGTQSSQQIQDLTQLVDHLRTNATNLEAEKAALTQQLTAMRQQVNTMTQQVQTTTQANQDLSNNVTHLETETGILTQTLRDVTHMNQDLYTNVTALENQKVWLTQQVQDLTKANQILQDSVAQCHSQEASCEQRVNQTAEACNHTLESNKAVLTQQIQALTQQNHDLQSNVTSLESNKAALTLQLHTTTQQNHDLQTNVTHLVSEKSALTQQLSQETQLNHDLQNNLTHLESERNALAHQVHSLDLQKISLEQRVFSLDRELVCFKQQGCPCGWHYHSGSCYVVMQQPANYTDAKRHCETMGGKLAEITSAMENVFLTNICNTNMSTFEVFLGLTDVVREGHFVYTSTGQTALYQHFALGEPTNSNGGEDCVTLYCGTDRHSFWNDADCAGQFSYVCEHDI